MKRSRIWTEEEELYLQEHWGSKSVTLIAKHLGRPYSGVRRKASKLGLLNPTLHYDGITVRQLALALGVSGPTTMNWIKNHGFPAKKKVFSKKKKIAVVSYDDFWEWAEKHKSLINFAKMEPLILGKEPEWVKERRAVDQWKYNIKRPWTEDDKKLLVSMVKSYKYTYPEISTRLKRPESSIKQQLIEMNIKARPIALDRHIKYTDEEIETILKMLKQGYPFNAIAYELNKGSELRLHKSADGIRGKLERLGYTFHGDKIYYNPPTSQEIV